MTDVSVIIPSYMKSEMDQINNHLSRYPGHTVVADSLGKFCPQKIVAGLIGCIIPESGSDPTILNSKEFKGGGVQGTERWNCGEGLIQWTYWKYKLPLIQAYNADSRSTQKLPTTWEEYNTGEPIEKGNRLYAPLDGKHIAGLNMDNHMLFLTKYYEKLINQLQNETNLAVIVAKIYQQKAGSGFYTQISDPIVRAYTTSREKYPSSAGNHYLNSLKIAQEYLKCQVKTTGNQSEIGDYIVSNPSSSGVSYVNENGEVVNIPNVPNKVSMLAYAKKANDNVLKQNDSRKAEFESLRNKMTTNSPEMGREILITSELYDSNILKGPQESRKERQ